MARSNLYKINSEIDTTDIDAITRGIEDIELGKTTAPHPVAQEDHKLSFRSRVGLGVGSVICAATGSVATLSSLSATSATSAIVTGSVATAFAIASGVQAFFGCYGRNPCKNKEGKRKITQGKGQELSVEKNNEQKVEVSIPVTHQEAKAAFSPPALKQSDTPIMDRPDTAARRRANIHGASAVNDMGVIRPQTHHI